MRAGERLRARLLDAKQLRSTHGYVRVGIVVPKLGQTAVRRNRLKRRLRELVRLHVLSLAQSCDVVLRARREAYDAPFATLREDVVRLAEQLAPAA